MPGKVKVKILSGRNLPVMDRSSDTTDAYVEIKLGNTTYKTDVCRKSLNPQWNSEWYRFEVDDSELQDEPLQIRLMDHDTYSANDAIGKVYLDLNPLLLPTAPAPVRSLWSNDTTSGSCCNSSGGGGSFMSGWIPVYDTMHGIRGEVNIIVKVELFSDFNKFRQSSCGVQFFCSPIVPQGYHAQIIHGFVEELVVNDDPEYQWIDKIRTPRASNEARQTLFFKLSGEIQRKIGLKALDLGGNAVIGYCQNFDLEGESGIVARGIGTAVTLTRIQDNTCHMDSNLVNEYSLDTATSKSMLYSHNTNSTNVLPPKSPKIYSSNYGMKNVPYTIDEKDHPIMGHRFPGYDKPKMKAKKGKVTVVYQEERSRSVDRGKGMETYLKRGRSTQSLIMNANDEQSDICSVKSMQRTNLKKIGRGLRAIGMLPKSILLKKTSKYRGKLNSDSSSVQGDESEVDSLSDWPVREVDEGKKSSKYRGQNDSSHYGLDRVLEVKETTVSPPGTPTQQESESDRQRQLRKKEFMDDESVEKNESSDTTSSDSSSSDETSRDSSPRDSNSLSTMKAFSFRKKSLKMMFKTKKHSKNTQSEESDASPKKYPPEEKKQKSRGKKNRSPIAFISNATNEPKIRSVESGSVEHDAACPQINVVCYDQDEAVATAAAAAMAMSACSHAPFNNNSNNNSCCLVSPLHKSKSATALDSYPSHECERALSSVLIAPDYKEHGPCLIPPSRNDVEVDRIVAGTGSVASSQPANPQIAMVARSSQSPGKITTVPCMHRRSSDSDLSITPKGSSLTGSDRSSGMRDIHTRQTSSLMRPSMNQESLEMLEYPFLTMVKYPPGFIQHLGGTVSARSVKLLERITNLEEPETRDAWWTELRMEVRSHTRAMGCNVVIGYSENTSICDDVCVLSASGTAALISLNAQSSDNDVFSPQHMSVRTISVQQQNRDLTASLDRCDFEKDGKQYKSGDTPQPPSANPSSKIRPQTDSNQDTADLSCCTICHIPYSESSVPFRVNMQKCAICRRGKVPDVLFTTIDLIDSIPIVGKGSFIHAYVCRPKRDCKGEMNAKEISDGLPFLEYELHRLLINKLKVRGMNTIFGLKVQVSIGEKMLIGLATGTATFLAALPTPPVPKVSAGNSWKDSKKFSEMQKQLQETVKRNRDFYHLKSLQDSDFHVNGRHATEDTDESDDDLPDLDLSFGNKDTCILEVDDAEDADVVSLLIDPMPPDGFHVVNTEAVPGLDEFEIVKNLQMFTQVWRAKIPLGQPLSAFNQHFNRLLQSVYYKLRNMAPCALNDLRFKITLEQDEIQLSLLGMALGLGESDVRKRTTRNRLMPSLSKETVKKIDDSDLIFNLEEDAVTQNKSRNKSPLRSKIFKHMPPRSRYGVDITPLSYVPGGKIEKYLGNLNFFFIRESTCIREGGGLSGFIHSFITEVLAIVRAHVTALGGNAMVAYFMTECFLYHYPHKNQGQCLINVGGDVVYISYFPDDQ